MPLKDGWLCVDSQNQPLTLEPCKAQQELQCSSLDQLEWNMEDEICRAIIPQGDYPVGALIQLTDPQVSDYDLTPNIGTASATCQNDGTWSIQNNRCIKTPVENKER